MNTLHIASFGTDLSSRTTGRKIRETVLKDTEPGVVILDFGGVRSITHSFADELIAVLIQQRGDTWFREHVQVQNHNPLVRLALLDAIEQRLSASSQNAA